MITRYNSIFIIVDSCINVHVCVQTMLFPSSHGSVMRRTRLSSSCCPFSMRCALPMMSGQCWDVTFTFTACGGDRLVSRSRLLPLTHRLPPALLLVCLCTSRWTPPSVCVCMATVYSKWCATCAWWQLSLNSKMYALPGSMRKVCVNFLLLNVVAVLRHWQQRV